MAAPRKVLLVLDSALAAAAALELSAALVRAAAVELDALFVENAAALDAAALPFARVLRHPGGRWEPLERGTIEDALREQARRVQRQLDDFTGRFNVPSMMRIVRGSIAAATRGTAGAADLVLVGAVAPWPGHSPARRRARRRVLAVVYDDSEASIRALGVARQLAADLPASIRLVVPASSADDFRRRFAAALRRLDGDRQATVGQQVDAADAITPQHLVGADIVVAPWSAFASTPTLPTGALLLLVR
ncbi:MAG TPA: hypothetical protein VMU33_01870 [Burkholderiaceae bacterium]|nr:hypothetical protein [Burkholderiaceae bacterium]